MLLETQSPAILQEELYEVHPNPFNEEINLICHAPAIDKETDIRIYDIHGDLLISLRVNRKKSIRIGKNLQPGMYFLSISSEDVHQVLRVVKK
jgi:hypothetical protein